MSPVIAVFCGRYGHRPRRHASREPEVGSRRVADILAAFQDLPAFVEKGPIGVNTQGNFGEYPLDVAAVRGDVGEVLALLEAGASINQRAELGNTALHEAASQGHEAVVTLLLEWGADPTIVNDYGQTPLDVATLTKEHSVVAILSGSRSGSERDG